MKQLFIFTLFLLTPSMLYAQVGNLKELFGIAITLVLQAVPIIVALALLAFFWGLANFILNAANEEKRSEGKQIMIWGIIVLFLLISVWGIVAIIDNTFFEGSNIRALTPFLDIGPNPFDVNPIIDCTDPINAQNQFCRDVN